MEKKQTYHPDQVYKLRAQHRQENLATARPVIQPGDTHRRDPGGARGNYPRVMESSLRNLSLDDIKEEKMMISQVDGLVDYSSSEEDASDSSSEGKPHIWEVTDSKTWVLHQLEKMRKHKNYDKIINYRDNGDDKWHKRISSVLN